MRRGVGRRSACAVPVALLSLLPHFSDLRRGGNFFGAICRGIHRSADRGVRRDSGFPPVADRGTGLGLEQRLSAVGAMRVVKKVKRVKLLRWEKGLRDNPDLTIKPF